MKKINSYFLITRKKIPAYLKYYWSKITSEIKTKVEGIPPIILLKSLGKNLINYLIYGNSIQNGTPTHSNPVEIESVGEKTKNLFNINNHNNGAPNRDYYVPNLKDGISYTFSCYVQSTDIIIVRGISSPDDTSGTEIVTIRRNDGYQTRTFVASSNYYRYIVRVYNISTNTAYNIQLEEGNTATAYEPYGYKIPVKVKDTNNVLQSTTNIYLDEPLRKIGDYADYVDFKNQKVFRNVIVNDDTGTDTIENSYTGTTDSSGTPISLPNIPTIKGTTIIDCNTEIQPSKIEVDYLRRG